MFPCEHEDQVAVDDVDRVPQHQDVVVQLYGEDGNVYAIIGRVGRALKRAGYRRAAAQFYQDTQQCASYTAVLDLVQRTVKTE